MADTPLLPDSLRSSFADSSTWTHHEKKPPNYPPRRADTSSATYHTFRGPADGHSGQPALGLPTRVARRRLLGAIERQIDAKERSPLVTREFRDPFALLLLLCALFRFADAGRLGATSSTAPGEPWGPILEGLFLVGAAAVNVLLNARQRRRHHEEMAERLRVAVRQMTEPRTPSSPSTASLHGLKPTVLHPSTSLVACYRDSQWQRIPMNLLVEGDVIALMSGDVAPGDVRSLGHSIGHGGGVDEPALRCARGDKIPASSATNVETTRCNATFNAPLLLSLCGDMRVFEMLETPVIQDIQDAFFRINRPETYTQKLQAKARLVAIYVCTMYSVFVLLAIGLRVVVQHRSLHVTMSHILLGPIGIWLCFASLNTPLVLFLAEAAATSSILASFEQVVTSGLGRHDQGRHHVDSSKAELPLHDVASPLLDKCKQQSIHLKPSPTDLHATDLLDSEDREKIRSEKASRQSAFRRSLEYFLVAIRFRAMNCEHAHHNRSRHFFPVPFRTFRLLERLGSTTMLCCFDDDILCEQTPSTEEIFLLNDKQGCSTVLDLHPDRDCETGLKFEDPKWRQHLSSLKPIGLSILLNDAEDPADYYHTSMGYLMSEMYQSSENESDGSSKNPCLRACIQRLSAHVRMLPFPKHLLNLSREIGFVRDDLAIFKRLQSLHIICPRLAHHEHTIDHHDQGQEDTRYRGNLKTHMYSTIVQDQRSSRLQLLSRGHPIITLAQCSEYWDGKSICPLTQDKRRAILDMYNQWRVEDLDCVAFSYVPVPHKQSSIFFRYGDELPLQNGEIRAPVYLVEDSIAGEVNLREPNVVAQCSPVDDSGSKKSRHRIPASPSPVASTGSNDERRMGIESNGFQGTGIHLGPSGRPISPSSRQRSSGVGGGGVAFSDAASSIGMLPSDVGSTEKESLLWQIQDDQIFLGMVATGVQPKQTIPDFIEDLMAAGIRFVYFSPRNMRRSKLLAEKMGIETDWNCAISLRSLDSDGPDPHRMTSNYSDWDVKARLPHGVEAIKRHIQEVDNVPLLVSLYTDSTPETIKEMIEIFQDNDEVVMGVGTCLKSSNAALFSQSDVAIALQTGLHTLFDEAVPTGTELPIFSRDDVDLSNLLGTLTCSFSGINGANNCEDKSASNLTHLIELIRLGRCMLTNFHQMISFIFVSQLFLATLILCTYVIPFPLVPQLSCASIFWFLWILVPALSLCMLATPEDKDVMKRTPRKNDDPALQDDLPRLTWYFVARHVPAAIASIIIFEWIVGVSLRNSRSSLGPRVASGSWIHIILHSSVLSEHPRPPQLLAAIDRAEGAMTLVIGLSVIVSSASYLYRCESMFEAPPLRNRIWLGISAFLLLAQLLMSTVRAGFVGVDGMPIGKFLVDIVPWYFWVVILAWPVVMLGIDEAIKSHDRQHLTRYYKFLRMQFDTRLGMWSPK